MASPCPLTAASARRTPSCRASSPEHTCRVRTEQGRTPRTLMSLDPPRRGPVSALSSSYPKRPVR
jgi:hypothetical protein